MVYVLDIDSTPLMPCTPAKARHLLEQGKAVACKSFSKEVFVIQLTFAVSGYKEDITLGVDAGHKTVGLSASSERKEYYSAEVELRNDIPGLLTERREARRTRRNRLRHRASRFNNRTHSKSKGWLAPSVEEKIGTHMRAVNDICSILPISKIIIETASFDIQKLKNPDIEGEQYQQGERMGFWNTREYVLFRDGHVCQACKGRSKDPVLEVHHIIRRSDGGTDRPENLITLCATCHHHHHNKEPLKLPKPQKGFKAEAFMGIMRWTVFDRLKEAYGDIVHNTYGYITKNTRIAHNLPKAHRVDALCIAGHPDAERLQYWLCQKKVRCHNRKVKKSNKVKGGKLKANQTPWLVKGFRLFDKVECNGEICFITGRRTSGFFMVKTLAWEKVSDSISYKKLRLVEPRRTILTVRRKADSSPVRG